MTEVLTRTETPVDYSDDFPDGIQDAVIEDDPHTIDTTSNNVTPDTDITPAIDTVDALDTPTDSTPEDTRELSPTGSSILRAASRINRILEKRAMNAAHREAITEDKAWTTTKKAEQDAAFETYKDNVTYADNHVEGLKMNEKFDRKVERKANRDKNLEVAKDKLRGFGRVALNGLKDAGFLTLGAGIMAGEAASSVARSGVEAGKIKAASTIDTAKDISSSAREALEYKKQAAAKQKEKRLSEKYKQHADWNKFKRSTAGSTERVGDDRNKLRRTASALRMAGFVFNQHR